NEVHDSFLACRGSDPAGPYRPELRDWSNPCPGRRQRRLCRVFALQLWPPRSVYNGRSRSTPAVARAEGRSYNCGLAAIDLAEGGPMSRLDRHVAVVQGKLTLSTLLAALAWSLLIYGGVVWLTILANMVFGLHLL